MPLLYNTWTEFFQAKLEENGSYGELSESPISQFNDATKSHVGNPDRLRLSVASNKFNFILVTGPDKSVLLVHSAVLISQSVGKSPIIVGIHGNRSTSPFRVIPAEAATTAARTGRARASATARWKVPSLTQFLEAGTEKEFLGLRAIKDNEDKNQLDFSKLPNPVSHTHLRAHETKANILCRLLLEKKKSNTDQTLHFFYSLQTSFSTTHI